MFSFFRKKESLESKIDRYFGDTPEETYQNGKKFFNGNGVEKDVELGIALLIQAAGVGHVCAQTDLGFIFLHGLEVKPDFEQALPFLRMAVAKGDPRAKFNLSFFYLNGLAGVPTDLVKGAELLRDSAEAGVGPAQYQFGMCCWNGIGVPKDMVQAAKWLDQAAQNNVPEAICNLGLLYINGEGVEQSAEKGILLIQQAARMGLPNAQKILADNGLDF